MHEMTLIRFDHKLTAPGERAVVQLEDGRWAKTSPIVHSIYHPTEMTCWIETRNSIYRTNRGDL